jgi:ABC-type branched-subunit amino acid transport system substrate-binding protein/outer membrane protein assembly factor BamD (BamD/ComL family)
MKKLFLLGTLLLMSCAHLKPKVFERFESNMAEEKAALIYERGNNYFKEKDYRDAIKELIVVVDEYDNTDAYEPALYLTAFSFYKLNKFKSAAKLGEKFIEEFPNSTYLLNATSLVGESYYKLAEDYKATYFLTKFYTQTDDSVGRKKAFERIIKLLPELSIKQLEKMHRVFMADPIDEHILYNLAKIEAREGKKEEAERDFNLLTRRFPNTIYTYDVQEYRRFINLGETTGRAGILLPLTGEYTEFGERLLEIVKLFESNKNLPFTLHFLDTKSDPIDAMVATAKLIDDLHVDFLIAPIRLVEAFGVCGLAYGKGVPLILPMTSESRFQNIPLVFTTGQSSEVQAQLIAKYGMYDLGITKFAILYPAQSKYKSIAEVFASEVIKNKREVVSMVSFHPDSITLKWEIHAIKEKEPEAIFIPMDKDMIINTTPQIAYYGLEEVQLLGIETFKDEKVPRLGEKYVEGVIFAAPARIDSFALKEFIKEGYGESDFSAKFFYTLWRLKELKNYSRSALPNLISKILKFREICNIYKIKKGEFEKLAELSK